MNIKRRYKITGVAPLLLHSGKLSNPMDTYARDIKKISGKRKKTDEDLMEMAYLEFMGSLYVDKDNRAYIPGDNWFSCIRDGAKKTKQGKQVLSALTTCSNTTLKADGPDDVEERWNNTNCVDQRSAKVGMSRVLRTRPIFDNWSTELEVDYDAELIDAEDLDRIIETAGRQVGIGDNRPRCGRFKVEVKG